MKRETKTMGYKGLQEKDQFDRLPDPIVCLIFNKAVDAKSLCRCLAVCKRFSSLIPKTKTVSFTISQIQYPNPNKEEPANNYSDPITTTEILFLKPLVRYVISTITKTQFNLCTTIDPTFAVPKINYEVLPHEAVRNFTDLQSLQIELRYQLKPAGNGDQGLLKWKARPQNGILVCVILFAESFRETNYFTTEETVQEGESDECSSEQPLTSDENDMRNNLVTSCFSEAVARCVLVWNIPLNHKKLSSVVISDANKRGEVFMGKDSLEKLRSYVDSPLAVTSRGAYGAPLGTQLETKLWYAPFLELRSSGYVMNKATLIMTSTADKPAKIESDETFIICAFEREKEAIREAAMKLIKKRKDTFQTHVNLISY